MTKFNKVRIMIQSSFSVLCLIILTILVSVDGHAEEKNTFEKDYFGLPKVEIRFLEEDSKTGQKIPVPNAQFKEKHPNGRLNGWPYDMTYNKAAKISTYTSPEGKEALKLENLAIIYSPPVEINYKMNYRIEFKYMVDGNGASVRLNCHDTSGKIINSLFKNIGTLSSTENQFKIFSKEFVVSSEVHFISFSFFAPKKGSLIISELSLYGLKTRACVDAKVYPWSFVDGRFALIQDELVPMCISLANPQELKPQNPRFIMELPDGIDILGGIYGMPNPKIIQSKGGYSTWSVPIPPLCPSPLFYKKHKYPPFFRVGLFTKLPATHKNSKAYFYYKDDNVSQTKQNIELMILPPIPPISKLKQYRLGGSLGTPDMCFDGNTLNLWANLYAKTGFNIITFQEYMMVSHSGANRSTSDYYKTFNKQNIKVFLEPFLLANKVLDMGYFLCRPLPSEVQLTWLDGTTTSKAACPTWIATSPKFKKSLRIYLRDLFITNKRCDSFALNWEPWPYHLKSCFDDRCLKDFAQYINKDFNYIKKIGSKGIIEKYKKQWIDFRNVQLGNIMKTIYEVLYELESETGNQCDLMPYIGGELNPDDPNYPGDVGKYCRIVVPFLYPGRHFFLTNYKGYKNLFCDDFPKNIQYKHNYRRWAKEQNNKRPPKIYRFATFDVLECISTPAQLRLMALLDIMYGCHATLYYRFEMGYDGRFYHTFARICNDLAKLEPYFSNTNLTENPNVVAEGYPTTSVLDINEGKWQPDFINTWMVTDNSNSQSILSIANVQERWKAVVHCSIPDIAEGSWTLYDPLEDVYLSVNNKATFSKKELEEGFYLALQPNEIRFWVIEQKKQDIPKSKIFTPKADRSEFDAAKHSGEQKVEQEQKNKKKPEKKVEFKLNISSQDNSTFKVYATDYNNNGEEELILQDKNQKLVISVAHGAHLVSWKVKEKEIVRKTGMLLKDKLWDEKDVDWTKFYNTPYTIQDIGLSQDRLSVVLESSISPLPLRIRKQIILNSAEKEGFEVNISIKNTGDKKAAFSYWGHNQPEFLVKANYSDCNWFLPTVDGIIRNPTFWREVFYPFTNLTENDINLVHKYTQEKGLNTEKKAIAANWTALYVPSRQVGLKVTLEPEKTAYYYYYDSMNTLFCTLEWIYRRIYLKPGQQWDTRFGFKVVYSDQGFSKIQEWR